MNPRQKTFGYVVFLVSLAAIVAVLFFVGGPIANHLRKPKLIEPSADVFHDEVHHVTCWTSTIGGIACLRDQP